MYLVQRQVALQVRLFPAGSMRVRRLPDASGTSAAKSALRRGFQEIGTMNDSSQPLHGKVAVVTGGGRGIGHAISAPPGGNGRDHRHLRPLAADLEAAPQADSLRRRRVRGHRLRRRPACLGGSAGRARAKNLRPHRHPGEQRRGRRFQPPAASACARGLGAHPEHQPARRVSHHPLFRAHDDRAPAAAATSSTSPPSPARIRCPTAPPTRLRSGD